jgi:hypothetical protein
MNHQQSIPGVRVPILFVEEKKARSEIIPVELDLDNSSAKEDAFFGLRLLQTLSL